MPKMEEGDYKGLLTDDIFLSQEQKATIAEALKQGRNVKLHHTGFLDPGDDFSMITIDGTEVARINGY
jgi:hypothetical protein